MKFKGEGMSRTMTMKLRNDDAEIECNGNLVIITVDEDYWVERGDAQSDVEHYADQLNDSTRKMNQLTVELTNTKSRVCELIGQMEAQKRENCADRVGLVRSIIELQSERDELKKQIEELRNEKEYANTRVEELADHKESWKRAHIQSKAIIKELQDKVTALEGVYAANTKLAHEVNDLQSFAKLARNEARRLAVNLGFSIIERPNE